MFGTIVNNRQLIDLISQKKIYIHPFKKELLKSLHYPLTASKYLICIGRKAGIPTFNVRADFKADCDEVIFKPKEYLIAEIFQAISVSEGIVGSFIPSSRLIDYGFSLTCGRIEAPYGDAGEVVRFGITNQLDSENRLTKETILGYVQFFDFRALATEGVIMTDEDKMLFNRWKKLEQYVADSGIHPRD
jgi:deoxycytidine triphosphate deaminase